MSINILDKNVLPTIAEEDLQTQTTQGDEPTVIGGPPRLNFPASSETILLSDNIMDALQSYPLEKKNSDDTTFIVSHSNHMNKPIVRFETTLSVNLYQIKDIFERICKKRGFEIVDDEGDQVTAVNKKMIQWKDLIFSCIPGSSRTYQNLTAIRLHSKTNKVTCIRRITIKALIGDLKLANGLFADFGRELESFTGRRANMSPPLNGSTILTDNILGLTPNAKISRYQSMRDDLNADVDESVISTQNLESASFYEFRKILSAEQYSIGKRVAEFVRDFMTNYKSASESAELLPQPMESVYFVVNEITETFFADFNYGKKETKQMMPFCRISVEKYVFDKIYTQLFGMYLAKYEQEITKFEAKTKSITEQIDFITQLKFLDIPAKFWLIPSDKLDESNNLIQSIQPEEMPYLDAINEFNKISRLKSPREKLGALLMMHSLMKAAVVDFHKGKEEVCSMDEELPILIYILLHSNLENAAAEFNFVDDYVQCDPALESEKRLMTNLRVSLQYIADEWKN